MIRSMFNLTKFSLLLLVGVGFVSACIRSSCPDPDSDGEFGDSLSVSDVHPECFKQTVCQKYKSYLAIVTYECREPDRALGVIISKNYVLATSLNRAEAGKCNVTVTVGADERGHGGNAYGAEFKQIGAVDKELRLLKLDKSLKFDYKVRSIPMVHNKPEADQKAVLIGIELSPAEDTTVRISQADINVTSNEECKNLLKSTPKYLTSFESRPNTFCTKPMHTDCAYATAVLIVNDQIAGIGVDGFLMSEYEWIGSWLDVSHLTDAIEDLYDF